MVDCGRIEPASPLSTRPPCYRHRVGVAACVNSGFGVDMGKGTGLEVGAGMSVGIGVRLAQPAHKDSVTKHHSRFGKILVHIEPTCRSHGYTLNFKLQTRLQLSALERPTTFKAELNGGNDAINQWVKDPPVVHTGRDCWAHAFCLGDAFFRRPQHDRR